MSYSELILKWGELLLQWQVLAFIFVISIFISLKEEIRSILQAIEKRGMKFSTGAGFSAVLSANSGDSINLKEIKVSKEYQKVNTSTAYQEEKFSELAKEFSYLKNKGAKSRSIFVKKIKKDMKNIFNWDFLKEKLASSSQFDRFVSASLLSNTLYEIDAPYLLEHFLHEPSSLVRYRIMETLLLWLRTSKPTKNELSKIIQKLESYDEENYVVYELINDLKKAILKQQYD